jgi:hypothetical protein
LNAAAATWVDGFCAMLAERDSLCKCAHADCRVLLQSIICSLSSSCPPGTGSSTLLG